MIDHGLKLLLILAVVAGILWLARAIVIAMEFDR